MSPRHSLGSRKCDSGLCGWSLNAAPGVPGGSGLWGRPCGLQRTDEPTPASSNYISGFTGPAQSLWNMHVCSKCLLIVFPLGVSPETVCAQGHSCLMGKTPGAPEPNPGPQCYLQGGGVSREISEHVRLSVFRFLGSHTKGPWRISAGSQVETSTPTLSSSVAHAVRGGGRGTCVPTPASLTKSVGCL